MSKLEGDWVYDKDVILRDNSYSTDKKPWKTRVKKQK